MGVEYRHELRPVDDDHRPTAATLARLVARLRSGRWLPRGDDEASRYVVGGAEVTSDAICWLRKRPATKHTPAGWSWQRLPHAMPETWIQAQPRPLVVRWSITSPWYADGTPWLRYPLTPAVDGEAYYELALVLMGDDAAEPDDDQPWLADRAGFSVEVDCGKCFPRDGEIAIDPALRALVEQELDVPLTESGEYY